MFSVKIYDQMCILETLSGFIIAKFKFEKET